MAKNNDKVQQVEVYVEGKMPFLMNPVTDELLEELRTKVSKPKARDRSREDEAKDKIYRQDGKIGVPAENLFACLVEAGRQVELKPRQKISTKETTMLPSFLVIEDLFLPFEIQGDEEYDPEEEWKADTRRGRNPKDGVMVAIVRPRFNRWGFTAHITVDTSVINLDKVKTLFEIAGRSVGLGDFRPARRGPFGTFLVKRWAVLSEEAVHAAEESVREAAKV